MAAHRVPYTATASVGYPEDFIKKLKKAKCISSLRDRRRYKIYTNRKSERKKTNY